jgi:hypothetical protein
MELIPSSEIGWANPYLHLQQLAAHQPRGRNGFLQLPIEPHLGLNGSATLEFLGTANPVNGNTTTFIDNVQVYNVRIRPRARPQDPKRRRLVKQAA